MRTVSCCCRRRVWGSPLFFISAGSGRRVDDPPFLKVSLDVGWPVSAAGVPGKKGNNRPQAASDREAVFLTASALQGESVAIPANNTVSHVVDLSVAALRK